MKLTVKSFGSIGAEVVGADLTRPLAAAEAEFLVRAWHEHLVLTVRGQDIDDNQLAAFTRNFGDLEHAPIPEAIRHTSHAPGTPEISVISNVIENGVPIGALGDGEAAWHTDMSYVPNPPPGCILYSLEIPSAGGDTWFSNMYAAYDSLPAALKRRIQGLTINHDASTSSTGDTRKGFEKFSDVSKAPGMRHPIALTHPRTGRTALYLGRRLHAWVVGMPIAESEALLDELWHYAAPQDHIYVHRWRVGDLVMWDNRCVMHRRDAWNPRENRIMHRTQLRNAPVF